MEQVINYNKGFVALLSALIISVVLVGTAFTMSTTQFFARAGTLNTGYKAKSRALSSSCVRVVLEDILEDYSYHPTSGAEQVPVGKDSCSIDSATSDPEDLLTHLRVTTILVSAHFNSSFTKLQVKAVVHNPAYPVTNGMSPSIRIISWTEL